MTVTDVVLLVVLAIAYALVCRIAPLGHCRRCHGTGADTHHHGHRNLVCCAARFRRCHGTGLRPRLGARLLGLPRRPDGR